jgi:hypothetical protein
VIARVLDGEGDGELGGGLGPLLDGHCGGDGVDGGVGIGGCG